MFRVLEGHAQTLDLSVPEELAAYVALDRQAVMRMVFTANPAPQKAFVTRMHSGRGRTFISHVRPPVERDAFYRFQLVEMFKTLRRNNGQRLPMSSFMCTSRGPSSGLASSCFCYVEWWPTDCPDS
jgi:hypothetical protein